MRKAGEDRAVSKPAPRGPRGRPSRFCRATRAAIVCARARGRSWKQIARDLDLDVATHGLVHTLARVVREFSTIVVLEVSNPTAAASPAWSAQFDPPA